MLRALLRAPEGLSGESLATSLGLSRAAVWKAVEALRRNGFDVEGRAGAGYRLVSEADRLEPAQVEARLETRWLGRTYVHHEQTGSTNADAFELASAGTAHGTVVAAESQTAGRGRLGRTWHSPPGRDLTVSIVLRPRLAAHAVASIGLVAGIAVARAIERHAHVPAKVKWPNDVWVGGRKVAGILTEMAAELDRVHHVVVGIGVNVNGCGAELPADVAATATTLRDARAGATLRRADLLAALLAELEPACERFEAAGFEPFVAEFDALDALAASAVRVMRGAETVEGRALGVASDGALRIARAGDGAIETVYSGEVVRIRAVAEPAPALASPHGSS